MSVNHFTPSGFTCRTGLLLDELGNGPNELIAILQVSAKLES